MSASRHVRVVALTLWLTAACGGQQRPAPEANVEPVAGADAITLERGPCFGTCPVYTVTLAADGSVWFDGHRFVADSGVSTGRVPRARADSLFAELESAGYFALADSYRAGDAACRRYATDLPTVTTEVRRSGRVKRIVHDRGCAEAPQVLSELETRIDEVAGVRQWVDR
jgi:hypothetical protein